MFSALPCVCSWLVPFFTVLCGDKHFTYSWRQQSCYHVSQFFLDLPRDEATHHLLMGLCPHSDYHTASKQWAYLMQENADFRESGWALLCWLLTQDLALGRCYMCDQWASDGTNIRNKQRSISWILKILLILNGHRLDSIYWTSGFIIFLNSWELLWQRGGIVLRVNIYLGINRVIIML